MHFQEKVTPKDVKDIVILFSGDSGDGMQLSGTIFSNLSAILGDEIATFPDYPAEIRAPQGTLSGVSGFQVHLGTHIYTAGDKVDVLVAMNPAALKVNATRLKKDAIIIADLDSFQQKDLDKALFKTENPFTEMGLNGARVISIPITTLTRDGLINFEMSPKDQARCKNMFALGLICWLFNKPIDMANHLLINKFSHKPLLAEANIKVLADGFNYGQNTDLSVPTYRVETMKTRPGTYTDISGNVATAYGLIAAAESAGKELFLGSYPITPATDILHELVKRKELGVKAVQMEDEIAGVCSAIGASFAGDLAATSTSGPGLALKSEAIGLAVMAELPLVVIDVQRGGPSTGLPTKTEQTDLRQALYGRNGESPAVVIAASSPTNCFDTAYWAAKIALEHVTPVILLSDGYIANGSSAWRIPDMDEYPKIIPHDVSQFKGDSWSVGARDSQTFARYIAPAGTEGYTHRIGGLERDYQTGAISTSPENHQKMVNTRQAKIDAIANYIPQLNIIGNPDADLLVVGWGGTYGHLREAIGRMNNTGMNVALAHFQFINPLPKNTAEVLRSFPKVIVAEQNSGHLAGHLASKIEGIEFSRCNKVEGQPFSVEALITEFTKKLEE
ncbi:2-oxoglutarate ferredoxin oxidoreductase subunit alpha [Dysgonomonas sp. PH5-45]|uniref:2-oxoacid:acceptor oxidoreductase subunit alpha n=1 Tax=unclassified Dysgonomonas TaxID=2630389 RepID=UPI002473E4AB|nr:MULTISPECIES: 2-oxoacid:acceptor oxidoreductase subunit alpha [unclassified Dysgonomonas]MDH6354258.1 2-oxoglutarate ferredoxin oxidoreductase subunit alpha [Dysgonomonas sp. PH5-45]MDH6387159.1 2-oxoglutarate ferredoxin oxidoreductase subunit alpha [Dysgonomonas sp. PH5-37]